MNHEEKQELLKRLNESSIATDNKEKIKKVIESPFFKHLHRI